MAALVQVNKALHLGRKEEADVTAGKWHGRAQFVIRKCDAV